MTGTETKLAVPTIHLNGTSKEVLLQQLSGAVTAIEYACRMLAAASPNGRDYYTQESGQIARAMQQHSARMKNLHAVAKELETIADAIIEQ